MKSAAREWGSLGIRVNVILPGFMETPMTETLPSGVVERARQLHVLGEFNTPNRVAAMIWFLHETMRATSGQVFSLDSRIL
jgi:NAD(P)-dependent dehydrogenase (short-subunit alcohol dehydrogenase family)